MKKNFTKLLLLLVMMIGCFSVMAQRSITGKVQTQAGEALPGVSILVKGTTKGASTDGEGKFTIEANEKAVLVFSSIGMVSQEMNIGNKTNFIVTMIDDSKSLDEVVVVGYGTQKKTSLTGAISKFKDEKLDEAPVARLDQALQGKIAGVQIQNVSSQAGDAPKITIRGISSVNAGASPLIVVDGQPVADGLAYINQADVESVEVLKDAASAAIYGSRGASGVILITTKSGKVGKTTYNFKYSVGSKEAYSRYDIMTTTEYVQLLFKEAALRATDPSIPVPTGTAIASNADRAAYVIEQTMLGGKGTDWQSESLRKGIFQNVQLNASGGNKDVRYFISGGYQKDEGMMFKSNFEKMNIRTKIEANMGKRVKVSLNLNPSYSIKESPSENFTNFWRYPSFVPLYHNELTAQNVNKLAQWANIIPGDYAQPRHFSNIVYSGTMPDGSVWSPSGTSIPFSSAQNTPKSSVLSQDINVKEYRLQGATDMTVNLLPGLDFKTMASAYVNYSTGLNWANRNATADGVVNKGIYSNTMYIDLLSENTLNYTKSLGNHDFNALLGYTAQKTTISRSQVTGLDYPSDNIRTYNNASQIDKATTFNTENQVGLLSYLGRVTYGYKSKYLLAASFRADGSSYFGPGNKWGTFPSISGGWIISEESFFKNKTAINNLKIRASYGVSGNNRILDFGFLDLLYSANYPFGAGTGSLVAGQATSPSIIANKDITWESTFQTNLGIDLGILSNKIELSLDVYQSKTDKLLLQQSSMGFTGVPLYWNNIGSLDNKGFEFDITSRNIAKKGFKWTTSFNISHTQNKIIELGKEAFLLNQGERTEVYQNKVGRPLIEFFGFKTDGVWLSQAEIDAARADGLKSSLSNLFVPGGLKLVDINGDKVIDNNDRTVLGNPYPDFSWGITNNFTYKNFNLSFMLQGVQGGKLVNGDPNYNESKQRVRAYTDNRWLSPMFPGDGKTPYSTSGFNWMLTDYVVEDASYYALREVNLSYKLPNTVAKLAGLSSLRVYATAQNLYFHSAKGYRSLNPEGRANTGAYGSSLIDGYQRGSFPVPKTFTVGIDISF